MTVLQVTEEMAGLERLWIQCRMGLCSATSAGAGGNIMRCVDPATACRQPAAPHKETALQQVSVRGPLQILPAGRDGQSSSPHTRPVGPPGPPAGPAPGQPGQSYSTTTTLVEVPVEVAIAIALASFIVGALSTGVLWFLHSRAMQAKSVCY